MEKITYPLLCYELTEDATLGILVGTTYQLVAPDVAQLKQAFTKQLQQQYKKQNDYPFINIKSPKLKILEISIRPTYRTNNSSFPLTSTLNIPTPCVYGPSEGGEFECHLPLLDQQFVYYESKQFKTLATYIATLILNSETPEKLHRYLVYQKPVLETIELKVNVNRSKNFNWEYNKTNNLKVLPNLAEEFPFNKSILRKLSATPDIAWELEKEVELIVQKIVQQSANILVVGKRGVGKSTVLKQAFKKIATQVRKKQLNYTFWNLMAQRLTASTKYLGEWQEKCELLVEELKLVNGILWVQDIIQLIQTGGQGAEDSVAAFLLPFLQQGQLQIIGELSIAELDSLRRLLPGFTDLFQIVNIVELSEEKTQIVLQKFSEFSAKNLKTTIDQDALQLSYRLLARYYPYESFPGKAINFLGTCITAAKAKELTNIDKEHLLEIFINQTGLPALFLKDNVLLNQVELEQHFSNNIIGQPNVIHALTNVVKIFKAGLNNPYKPIQTLLFTGPTGVGKTASAKALAEYFFGKGQKKSPLIRIDMSEFQHPGMIYRFIGSNREVGKLVQAVREKPFSVLLLDEAEKADPSIFDALLSILDEGMLTDAYGRVTSFRNTIIILTTNIGANNRTSIGFSSKESEDQKYLSELGKFFRPEFINRLDSILVFHPLDKASIKEICQKELKELNQREGFIKRGIRLAYDSSLIDFLGEVGFDKRYGARPLQRAINTQIINPMANWLLDHPRLKNTTLHLSYKQRLIIEEEG